MSQTPSVVHRAATFHFTADAPPAQVGPLFGADRERVWAPGWAPRFLHPAMPTDEEGMVFTIAHDLGEAVWINTRFDLAAGVVQYAYVIPGVLATLITLDLTPDGLDGERTQVEVTYQRTALTAAAGDHVAALSNADRGAGPEWERLINDHLRAG
jgi:hypothetical protein